MDLKANLGWACNGNSLTRECRGTLNENEGTQNSAGLYSQVFRLSIGKFFMVTNVTLFVLR